MADPPAAPAKAGGGKAFWTHKLGPFPVYVWAIGVVAVGGYYWYTHYGPGASKQQSGQGSGQGQQKQGQAPRTRITEITRIVRRPGRGRGRTPRPAGAPMGSAGAAGDAAQAAAAGVPAQYGGGPGPGGTMAGIPAPPPTATGPGPDPDRKRRDRDKRDRDKRRHVAVGSQEQVTTQTGQPVSPDNGQPVYWEWTHAHRGPEISTPVPDPQQAYAPMTTGATYDAASTAADAAVA